MVDWCHLLAAPIHSLVVAVCGWHYRYPTLVQACQNGGLSVVVNLINICMQSRGCVIGERAVTKLRALTWLHPCVYAGCPLPMGC